jgi:PAS domain S-box-containing protein
MRARENRYNVLVVEDNPGDYILIEDYLEEANLVLKFYKAENFQSAKEILSEYEQNIDIILLDLSLPDKRGEPLLIEIQKLTRNKPIVILTGYPDMDFAVKSLAMGASDYLLKDVLNSTVLQKSIIYNIERNKILVSLKSSEQRYSDLFHFSPLPMWVFDKESLKFLDVNNAAIAHYGYTKEEFLGMDITQIRPKEEMAILDSALHLVKEKHETINHGEVTHLKKNGERIKVDVRSNGFEYKGKPAKIILINDVTERNQYVEAIEKQNKTLKEIAWTQSHVVRAPLARLLGLVNYLSDEEVPEGQRKQVYQHIQRSANELDEIIKSVVSKSQEIEINKDKT